MQPENEAETEQREGRRDHRARGAYPFPSTSATPTPRTRPPAVPTERRHGRHAEPMTPPSHRDTIIDQFSRQAVPFSTAGPIRDREALQLLVTASGAGAADTVLDVACGPGLVACAF